MTMLEPKTKDELQEFLRLSFLKYSSPEAAKMEKKARLIFERPAEVWTSEKIVIEYEGKLHFFSMTDDGDKARSIAAAVDTLVYGYEIGRRF